MSHGGFTPIARRSVSDEVFAELRDAILTGRFAPGDALPPERDLAMSFAVNRHAVREALKSLQAGGFVRVVHGGGTRVLDVRSTAGLDLLAHLARSSVKPDPGIVRDGLEMRRCIGIEAARLAALRADAAAHARIEASCAAYGDPTHPDADRAFWLEVVVASGNVAFRLALNSLVQAIDAWPDDMDPVLAGDRADLVPHAPLAAAIIAGDAARAGALADEILTQAIDVWAALTAPGGRNKEA
ncbi:transcriptional regulator [Intrasporangium oryzae NRRL B-24470]|uniref:Transcriptional regulator n=1 Tax=Intrasporangium oryzae NRRL B-24470 TaxID=1386089 RepID=W9G3A2_9MICO|nr:GntR family transcriptional regulator [Intrasporangium oryzae]EWS99781.1 transcriptional regulator [Intrasporangium oryzae NRRL B-24470]